MKLIVKIKKDFGSFMLDVDFTIENNSTAILGASGSGKSLTLKCIAGIIKPDEGYIALNDRVLFDSQNHINVSPQKRNIGYMFQSYALFPNMSVKQNIMCGLSKIKDKNIKIEKYQDIIKKMQLNDLENHYPSQLSGGQCQRVALARILVSNPEIILLDEPFSALDEHLRVRLEMDLKETISSFNSNVILVTHNRDEAYLLSNEIVLIEKGKNIIHKPTKELFNDPVYVYGAILTGCKNIALCKKIDENHVYVPSWDITLSVNKVNDDIKYVGLRAHSFTIDNNDNNLSIKVKDIIEEPFEFLLRFKFVNQKDSEKELYYRYSKNKNIDISLSKISIAKKDILLLK